VNNSSGDAIGVILAAGMGRRLGNLAEGRPKGFLEIGGRSLIERSLDALRSAGIRKVCIGTGFRSDLYEGLKVPGLDITCIRNLDYAGSGSVETLLPILSRFAGRTLLVLESDLLYHPSGLVHLLASPAENVILASPFTHSGDEVFIETDATGRLVGLSKERADLESVDAELTGINKVGPALSAAMLDFVKDRPSRLNYEDVFASLASRIRIDVEIFDFPWCEIDDETHLVRALDKILPAVEA
jgi:2-aminoethylphosphonate-pyruvate transaminase